MVAKSARVMSSTPAASGHRCFASNSRISVGNATRPWLLSLGIFEVAVFVASVDLTSCLMRMRSISFSQPLLGSGN